MEYVLSSPIRHHTVASDDGAVVVRSHRRVVVHLDVVCGAVPTSYECVVVCLRYRNNRIACVGVSFPLQCECYRYLYVVCRYSILVSEQNLLICFIVISCLSVDGSGNYHILDYGRIAWSERDAGIHGNEVAVGQSACHIFCADLNGEILKYVDSHHRAVVVHIVQCSVGAVGCRPLKVVDSRHSLACQFKIAEVEECSLQLAVSESRHRSSIRTLDVGLVCGQRYRLVLDVDACFVDLCHDAVGCLLDERLCLRCLFVAHSRHESIDLLAFA